MNKNGDRFVKEFDGIVSRFDIEWLAPLRDFQKFCLKTNVSILVESKLEQFGELFRHKRYEIIILFTHWSSDRIEFRDGLFEVTEVAGLIPETFSGFLDLTICHPKTLTVAVRNKCPDCLIKYAQIELTPGLWLLFYQLLFQYLKRDRINYLNALSKTVRKITSL
jgi:hypothetical protein